MDEKGKTIRYAAAGVLISLMVIAALFLSGVLTIARAGTLVVLVKDAPVDLAHLNVTIDSFSIIGNEGETILPFGGNRTEISFDLLALQNVTETIGNAQVPAGNYTKMRMTVKQANATFQDGSWIDLQVPPGKIDIIAHFEIKDGSTTVIIIDMQADWVAISESGNLRPVLKVVSITTTG